MPPAIALPIVTTSGRSPHAAVQPPGPALIVCVSSMISSVPVRSHAARSASWKPGSGRTMPMLVSAGSASTQATCPSASRRSTALDVVELAHPRGQGGIDRGPDVALPRARPAAVERDEGLVDGPVVAVAEDEHVRALRDRAAEPQRPAVGVGRGQREAPLRHPEAPGELLAHPGGVLGGQHQGRAALLAEAALHRGDRRRRRVPGHGRGVAQREVDVDLAVDVLDARAVRGGGVDRMSADPLGHPGHRHAADQ